jgi:hypothetical protein
MKVPELLRAIFIALVIIAGILILNLCAVIRGQGPAECHMTSFTTQVCELR